MAKLGHRGDTVHSGSTFVLSHKGDSHNAGAKGHRRGRGAAMGIITKWAIRLQNSDFYGPSPSTPPPPRCWVPPPSLRADFCLTRFHALPLYHTLLWKMGKRESYDMENMEPPPPLSQYL